eukprot:1635667-Ditylum_brightwellii.AAC.1
MPSGMLASTSWPAHHWAQLAGNPELANPVPRAIKAHKTANQSFPNPSRIPLHLVHCMAPTWEQKPLANLPHTHTHAKDNDLPSVCKWLNTQLPLSKPHATGWAWAVFGDNNNPQHTPVKQPHLPGAKEGGE